MVAGLLGALALLARPAGAQSPIPATPGQASLMDKTPQKTWAYLSGDTLSGHADKEVELQGNALMLRSETQISADTLRYDQRTDRMQAEGNVRIERNERIYTGTYLDMDVELFEGFFGIGGQRNGGAEGEEGED